jgi:hypothetical protein
VSGEEKAKKTSEAPKFCFELDPSPRARDHQVHSDPKPSFTSYAEFPDHSIISLDSPYHFTHRCLVNTAPSSITMKKYSMWT